MTQTGTPSRLDRLPRAIRSRYTPYLIVISLCALSPAMPHQMDPNDTWWWIAAANLALMIAVGFAAERWPQQRWLAFLAPMLLLPSIQWLRNADGWASSGFSPLIFLPVIWFAFYGRLRDVVLAVLGGACVLILPVVIIGGPHYPGSSWRGTSLFLIVLAFVGPLVHNLVGRIRDGSHALSVSEEQFHAAFEDAPLGAILTEADGRAVRRVNRAMCTLLGRTQDEIIGHDMVEFTHPDDIDSTRRRQSRMNEYKPGSRIEKRYIHSSGRVIWVAISFSAIRDRDGRTLNIIGQVEDISARLEADKALLESLGAEREAALRMREAEVARRDLVSRVSHDLRTPITAATGFAELLADDDARTLSDEQRRMIATIQRSLDRLAAIVDDLLTFSRTDREVPARSEELDIGGIIEAAVNGVAVTAASHGHELHYSNDLNGEKVCGDAARLDRALSNLLSNAVKFTPTDGRIGVRAMRDQGNAVIEVSDNGIGISDDDRELIFDQYFRSRSASAQAVGGTGLGLAIVREIADQHGGRVEVSSELGVGTTFTLTLPLAPEPATELPGSEAFR